MFTNKWVSQALLAHNLFTAPFRHQICNIVGLIYLLKKLLLGFQTQISDYRTFQAGSNPGRTAMPSIKETLKSFFFPLHDTGQDNEFENNVIKE